MIVAYEMLLGCINQIISTGIELLNILKEREIYDAENVAKHTLVSILKFYKLIYPILSIECMHPNTSIFRSQFQQLLFL